MGGVASFTNITRKVPTLLTSIVDNLYGRNITQNILKRANFHFNAFTSHIARDDFLFKISYLIDVYTWVSSSKPDLEDIYNYLIIDVDDGMIGQLSTIAVRETEA